MGRYDDITPKQMRAELLRFAELIQRMDREQLLLRASPRILKLLGELRQMLFAFEIRAARHLGGKDLPGSAGPAGDEAASSLDHPSLDRESLRIVREALEREKELQDELERRLLDPEEDKD